MQRAIQVYTVGGVHQTIGDTLASYEGNSASCKRASGVSGPRVGAAIEERLPVFRRQIGVLDWWLALGYAL